MIRWTVAVAVGLVAAWFAYGRTAGVARAGRWWLGALRALAVALVAALLVDAPAGRSAPLAPILAIDASASWRRAAGDDSAAVRAWRSRLADSLRPLVPDDAPIVLVGDSLRSATASDLRTLLPNDAASRVRAAVDQAAALGRPLLLVTDGDVDDPESLAEAPPGSRVLQWTPPPRPDVAVADLAVPPSVSAGDSITVAATLVAGASPTTDGALQLSLGEATVATLPIPPLAPFASTRLSARMVVPRGAPNALVRAVARVAADLEPRNDTLTLPIAVEDRPRAVFVSTAPDLDVREVLTVLRGALDVPTRAYLRLAPNVWRVEGTFAPVTEAEVRARVAAAGMVILHGDTTWAGAVFGMPGAPGTPRRTPPTAARALWTPAPPTALARAGETTRTPEWYAYAAPASPLMAALTTLPFDSLPPITLAGPITESITGATPVLTARLGRRGDPAPAVATREAGGRRTVLISGSGWSGWALRGGRAREAFTALWGALFDWLAAGRGDERAARPVEGLLRAGEPVRWRRGGSDSVVAVRLARRRVAGAVATADDPDTVTRTIHFAGGSVETTSAPLAPGVYDVTAPGGPSVLVVNAAREWVPRGPALASGSPVAGAAGRAVPRLTDAIWPFVLALLLLSGEWIGRRFVGQR